MITIEYGEVFFNFCYIGRNIGTWKRFIKANDKASDNNGGVNGFKHSLENVGNAHVWAAYISNIKPKKDWLSEDEFQTIEMAVTVTTSEKSCFIMNMGIFRSSLYNGEKHPNISMKLHGFAAEQILQDKEFEISKTYMVTVPLPSMLSIMEKNLEKIYIGINNSVIRLECGKNARGFCDAKKFTSLLMFDDKGEEIFKLDVQDKDMMQDMNWFISHSDVFGNPFPLVVTSLDELSERAGFSSSTSSQDELSLQGQVLNMSDLGLE